MKFRQNEIKNPELSECRFEANDCEYLGGREKKNAAYFWMKERKRTQLIFGWKREKERGRTRGNA